MSHFRLAVGVDCVYMYREGVIQICIHAQITDSRQVMAAGGAGLVATAECVITLGVPMTPAQAPSKRNRNCFPNFHNERPQP